MWCLSRNTLAVLLRQSALGLGCCLISLTGVAAGLGEIRVHSALGERFDAVVGVSSADNEALSSACFQVLPSSDSSGERVLHQVRIDFRKSASGGVLHIQGAEYEHEPLLKVVLRLRCPEEDVRGITREYNVLLDPRDYRAKTDSDLQADSPVLQPSIVRPRTQVASATVTNRTQHRHSSTRKPYQASAVSAVVASKPPLAAKQTPTPVSSTPPSVKESGGEFRLHLSTMPLDASRVGMNLSEDEKLKLRERLLLIEADDQTAQLLQLKDRIAKLEKRLSYLSSASAIPAAQSAQNGVPVKSSSAADASLANWMWAGIASLVLLIVGVVWWQRKQSNAAEQAAFFDFDAELMADPVSPVHTAELPPIHSPVRLEKEAALPVNEEWGSNDMDVVSPGNVAEEAQLLLAHGLIQQAADLLLHEISVRPTALALWMKLLEIYQEAGDVVHFQKQALAFREHFVSDGLWQQVQRLGQQIDPANPLYQTVGTMETASSDLFVAPQTEVDLLSLILPPAESAPKRVPAAEPVDMSIDFHVPELPPQDHGEWPDAPSDIQEPDEPLFNFDAPTLELPIQERGRSQGELTAEDLASSDPALQAISHLYFSGQQSLACQQLEEMLYKGSFEQRLTAAKWLDRMLPVSGHPQ